MMKLLAPLVPGKLVYVKLSSHAQAVITRWTTLKTFCGMCSQLDFLDVTKHDTKKRVSVPHHNFLTLKALKQSAALTDAAGMQLTVKLKSLTIWGLETEGMLPQTQKEGIPSLQSSNTPEEYEGANFDTRCAVTNFEWHRLFPWYIPNYITYIHTMWVTFLEIQFKCIFSGQRAP